MQVEYVMKLPWTGNIQSAVFQQELVAILLLSKSHVNNDFESHKDFNDTY